jgi:hypothetical protein
MLTALELLRVPPASPTPGAPRDRPSASQVALRQPGRRHVPDRDRPAHGAAVPASSPRVPDARRGARPTLGVAGTSTSTRSPARSRPRSACSRRCGPCEFPPRPRRPVRRATDPRRRRYLDNNEITGTFPLALCGVQNCYAKSGNDLVAPCDSTDCCDLGDGAACSVMIFGESYDPATTTYLRAPPASPTPGPARDRTSASQGALRQRDHRHDPARDRPAHEAEGAASSPRVPDGRRGARPTLGVAGTPDSTRSPARSRTRSACSRR